MELQTQKLDHSNQGMNNPSTRANNPGTLVNNPGGSANKKKPSKGKALLPSVVYTPLSMKSALSSSKKKTPVNQCTQSVTPMSNKKSPLQMTKQEHPAGFKNTKVKIPAQVEAFYVHIKVLWGLVTKGLIPKPLSDKQLQAFYQRFCKSDEIESAVNRGPLISTNLIQTLKKACKCCTKMVAIHTFCECIAGGAYTFMHVNQIYADNFDLFKTAYKHYIHYLAQNMLKG
ncbi:hypothetical protein VP01_4006g5 [Puccinia sorghi]|uniref:Uncharacterized protein n=1 Tax=Puccinia sorghi TaxID=27349 RepID=A0A0L6UTV7_9BASI|nr:hypothetical protein VP01_4006g5 [Puccinia sorghi]